MPARYALGGYTYHACNRAIPETTLFESPADYEAFEGLMGDAFSLVDMRVLAYCLMPNHWHLVVWPRGDDDLAKYMHWLTMTHAQRWRRFRESEGRGHLYQGRFRSFPVQDDEHLYRVCRYVERNALRANLVRRADEWRWCSLWRRLHRDRVNGPPLCDWDSGRLSDWVALVNEPQTQSELDAIRTSCTRGRPYGSPHWQEQTAEVLGLGSTLRPRGRPKKVSG